MPGRFLGGRASDGGLRTMADESRVISVIAARESARKQGKPFCLEDYCAGDTDLFAAVQSAFRLLDGSTATDQQDRQTNPPTATARYEFKSMIGEGGMGQVWKAIDNQLDREVAVKLLTLRQSARNQVVGRFLREARLAGHLQHPAIVPVHDSGTLPDGRPFFVMKLVEGRTFASVLQTRDGSTMSLQRHLTTFEQVCLGVSYAHARGVIHRDLKPQNVMIGAYGEAVLSAI